MWIRIAGFILRNRLPVLIVLGLLTAFMGFQSRQIEMSYEYAPLLPDDDPVYKEHENFAALFGDGGNLMVIGVRDSLFFDIDHFSTWEKLSRDIGNIEGVTSVISPTRSYQPERVDRDKKFKVVPVFDEVQNQQHLDSLVQTFRRLPFYEGLLYNQSSDVYLMAIVLDMEVLQSPARVEMVEKIEAKGQVYEAASGNELRFSGLPYIRVKTAEMIKKELNMFIWLALGITAIIMFLFFKSFKVVFFAMLVVGMAVIWALGLQAIIGFKITILTGMIPPLIIVIGIPNSVFLLNKFHHEFRIHGNKIKSLQRVIRKIGNATFLTNLTTASGFATFIFTSSQLLVEFGIMAAVNILVVFILSILLIPAIFSFLPDPGERHVQHLERPVIGKLLDRLSFVSLSHRNLVLMGTVGLLVFGGIGISRVKTTGYMLDDIPGEHRLSRDLKFFETHFSGLMPLEVVVDTRKPNGAMQPKTLEKMERLQDTLRSFPELSPGLSMVQVVKFARQGFYRGSTAHYGLPNQMDRNFIMSYLPRGDGESPGLAASFLDSTRQRARLSFRMQDVGTARMMDLDEEIRSVVNSVFPPEAYDVSITGSSIVFFKGTDYLTRNLFISLGLAVLLIALFMAWMFRSKRMVVVSLLPNLIPLIITAALMGFFEIPIKPSTILVFSIAFGISVDDTIHFLAKYRQELSETNWSIRAATSLALKETGRSMIYTSIILFFGFGIFTVSGFGGTVALGSLVAFTLIVALFANLILLPSLLLWLERLITNESFKEPMLSIYNEDEDIDHAELKIGPPLGERYSHCYEAEKNEKSHVEN